jgi:hypothetical protein
MNQRGGRSCEERNLMEVDPDVGKRWVKQAKNSKSPKMVALLSLVGFKIQHDRSLLQFSWVRSVHCPGRAAAVGTLRHTNSFYRKVAPCSLLWCFDEHLVVDTRHNQMIQM